MKCLSIQQPWAQYIAAGIKNDTLDNMPAQCQNVCKALKEMGYSFKYIKNPDDEIASIYSDVENVVNAHLYIDYLVNTNTGLTTLTIRPDVKVPKTKIKEAIDRIYEMNLGSSPSNIFINPCNGSIFVRVSQINLNGPISAETAASMLSHGLQFIKDHFDQIF